jgi:predicted small secreted protein
MDNLPADRFHPIRRVSFSERSAWIAYGFDKAQDYRTTHVTLNHYARPALRDHLSLRIVKGSVMRYLLIAGCVALVGCNTMNGLGQDMQRAGSSLSNKATGGERPTSAPEPVPYYPKADPQH